MTIAEKVQLKTLMQAERSAYRALMNDQAVIANPKATHTPALWQAYEQAAAAEREFRAQVEVAA